MNDGEKVLTYEEAKQMCMKAFDGGVTYGSESMRYGVNARAYDWEHWLAKNERLFKPKPTVEDVLREFAEKMNENLGMYTGEAIDADEWRSADAKTIAEYAKRLTLAEGEDA